MSPMFQAAGWIAIIFTGGLGALVLFLIFTGKINLEKLLSEDDGKASLSRLQFLIFTYVIAMGLLVVIFNTGSIPEIPEGVYYLLGISGGSYVGSKITQKTTQQSTESSNATQTAVQPPPKNGDER